MGSIIGIDIGGTNVRAALANDKGQILARLDEKTDKLSGPEGLSRQIIHMIHSLKTFEIDSIGIGSAGPLDLKEGSIVNSPHLGYKRIPLVRPLKSEFNIPVYLANDCVAGVVAEKEYGQGKKYSNLVYVTMSTGIGAGVYADGRLLLGKDGNAHEIGHITIDYTGALTCGCGCKGHWEAYCGGENAQNFIKYQLEKKKLQDIESSLIYRISGGDFTRLSSQDLFESAQKRDAIASA
ncbi:ROK family protein, partial [[Eubacterium] cellulosolvens]